MTAESIALFFTEGSSDKVYHAQLMEEKGGWIVNFQYGRRGAALQAGTKTPVPVTYPVAKKAYDALVKSKTSKGYTPEESGVAFAGTELAGDKVDFPIQLLNPIDEIEAEDLLRSVGALLAQKKHDGERRPIGIATSGEMIAGNRRGLRVGVQATIASAMAALAEAGFADSVFDSEDMGDHIVIFDLTRLRGEDVTGLSALERAQLLFTLGDALDTIDQTGIRIDYPVTIRTNDELRTFIAANRASSEEGVVFRIPDSPYTVGRPASGGGARKLKFYEEATVRVASVSATKRSIGIEALADGVWTDIGNCTIPANHAMPAPGSLVEVSYLYAYPGGSLFQPVYRGIRGDLEDTAADIRQLKMKA